jgi:hypothetical protein
VLVAGISGFRKPYVRGKNTSADVLYKWAEKGNFAWLVTEDILDEYKEVLKRSILSASEPNRWTFTPPLKSLPIPTTIHSVSAAKEGDADFIVTLNPKDFPQERLKAKVISPEAMA